MTISRLLAAGFVLASCAPEQSDDAALGHIAEAAADTALQRDANSVDPAHRITLDGLGPYRAGMTIGEFRSAAGDTGLEFDPDFMVDLSALCTTGEETPSVCAVVYMTESLTDDHGIAYLTTADPRFRTPDGIGPGVSLADAEAVLGPATLSFSYANESREFIRFAHAPENWLFTPSRDEVEQFAGFYDLSTGAEHFETAQYRPGTLIDSVDIYPLPDGQARP
ncbi:hypothetical protein [Hyphobacterium marinum]|uniref:Lipoprotein n=1 Tax=Hyphobacterium marinum TaxID=3116574 RepID=A0ABU7LWH7_9PROT|nr:hypothetical protein [Hyphobacterium sp. Y6023]MEE2565902.1 hypothetical protein [Hyphobacterium sp. Y6023]